MKDPSNFTATIDGLKHTDSLLVSDIGDISECECLLYIANTCAFVCIIITCCIMHDLYYVLLQLADIYRYSENFQQVFRKTSLKT